MTFPQRTPATVTGRGRGSRTLSARLALCHGAIRTKKGPEIGTLATKNGEHVRLNHEIL